MEISATPLPGYGDYFQQYLQHNYACIHVQWDVREDSVGDVAANTESGDTVGNLVNPASNNF